ncbi:hypothetical protein FRC17_005535 [Serendipita sp. 399]|nr:hypothetical protein FRC17_005535 [Serendipita sp. 399]
MSNDKRMQNPYIFPGASTASPSLTPIHLKRRSESHSSFHPPSSSSSSNTNNSSGKLSSKRPSTSAGTSVYSSSVYASSTISGGSSSSGGSGAGTINPPIVTKVRHPYTVLKRGKKHHAFPTQIAPYPLNYENRILDCDSLFANTNSPSLSPFIDNSNPATHPRRVLDVGCGTGAWCLKAAEYWPNTRFVGLDLVAIQPESYAACMQRIEGICRRVKEGKHNANVPKIVAPTIGLPRRSTSSNSTAAHHQQQQSPSQPPPMPPQLKPLSSTTSLSSSSSLSGHHWAFLLGELTRVLSIGGTLEIVEEDILFPVVLAPKITVGGTSSKTRPGAVPGPTGATSAAFAVAHQQALSSSRAHQKSLKSAYQTALSSLNELNRQTLIYSEENRPSAYLSSSPLDGGGSPTSSYGYGYPHSPVTPIEGGSGASIYDGLTPGGMGALTIGSAGGASGASGYYGIPASYLQYVQTVPALAHSLPPLALVNPFRHLGGVALQGGAFAGSGGDGAGGAAGKGLTPFAQDHAVLEKLYTSVYTRRWINMQPTKILANALGMQVQLGGVVASDYVEIAKPVGRAAFLGVVDDDVEEEEEEGLREEVDDDDDDDTQQGESGDEDDRAGTPALGRRGSGGSQTLLDEGGDDDDEAEGRGEDEDEELERPPSPPLTPTAASPEGNNPLSAPDLVGGAPRIRGPYPPQMRRRKRGRSSGAAGASAGASGVAKPLMEGKSQVEGGEGKAGVAVAIEGGEQVEEAKLRSRMHASTSVSRSKSTAARSRRAAKTASMLSTADFKKYPTMVLTSSLQAMFPNLNSEIAKTMHLQRAWENVVACKEAMWEEFLHDSSQREREAAQQSPSSSQTGHSSGSSRFTGAMGALSSGIGSMGGIGAMGVMGLGALPLPSPFAVPRRVPTLLDELEWADSDMRRSERERFDILLDRYEMRIRRHCARAYENSGIPCLVARDRQGWVNAEAELDSSEDEMYDDPVPPSPAPPMPRQGSSSGGATPPSAGASSSSTNIPPMSGREYLESPSSAALAASLSARDGSGAGSSSGLSRERGGLQSRWYDDPVQGREENSSSDEITLAEPQSPRSHVPSSSTKGGRPSTTSRSSVSPVSPVTPPFGRGVVGSPSIPSPMSPSAAGPSTTRSQPSSSSRGAVNLTEGAVSASSSSPLSPVEDGSLSRERGKRRMRSMSVRKQRSEDDEFSGPEKLPSRIIKAFIATKTQSV